MVKTAAMHWPSRCPDDEAAAPLKLHLEEIKQ
jgi:hypothetical protein